MTFLNEEEFLKWRNESAVFLDRDKDYHALGIEWMNQSVRLNYSYMFEWLGVPVIQYPSDLLLIQEAIVRSRTNKVIEVGIARGGTTLFLASVLELTSPTQEHLVVGVDISVSEHTHQAVKDSRFGRRIELIEGSSTLDSTFERVSQLVNKEDRVTVILDSNHTMQHVYREMNLYSKLVSDDSYLIVMDTAIQYLNPEVISQDRPWGKDNNPDTAVKKFLEENSDFTVDENLNNRSFPGAAKGGYLRRHTRNE